MEQQNLLCPACGAEQQNLFAGVRHHLLVVHGVFTTQAFPGGYACGICGWIFMTYRGWKEHTRRQHLNNGAGIELNDSGSENEENGEGDGENENEENGEGDEGNENEENVEGNGENERPFFISSILGENAQAVIKISNNFIKVVCAVF